MVCVKLSHSWNSSDTQYVASYKSNAFRGSPRCTWSSVYKRARHGRMWQRAYRQFGWAFIEPLAFDLFYPNRTLQMYRSTNLKNPIFFQEGFRMANDVKSYLHIFIFFLYYLSYYFSFFSFFPFFSFFFFFLIYLIAKLSSSRLVKPN